MSITEILSTKDIAAALQSIEKEDSFEYKEFFKSVGLSGKSPDHARRVFEMLDRDLSGSITEETVGGFLQIFSDKARKLTAQETKKFMKDSDFNGDGKIGIDEFQAMVKQ